MKNKAKEHNRFILGRTPLEAILSFRNWTGLTTRELWQAGRLGNHPGEYLMSIIEELFPTSQVSQIKPRNMLVSKAIEELNTIAPVYGYDKETK
tara:strand:+ start:416 stop:697 length:282 start_codon:yes stop_codon:yes gene_type:complete